MRLLKAGRYFKATARFMLLIGSFTCFALAFLGREGPWGGGPGSLNGLGLSLAILAAMFYDPDNPPHDRRTNDL